MQGNTVGRRAGAIALGLGILAVAWPTRGAATTANDLCQAGADPCIVSTTVAVTDGSTIDVGQRELRLMSGATVDAGDGTVTVLARLLTVQANASLRARATSTTIPGGTLTVQVGDANIAGTLDASGGPGGSLELDVTNNLSVTGTISARALNTEDVGGEIDISAGTATIGGLVSAFGGPDAIGGDVGMVIAGALTLSGTIDATGGDGGGIDISTTNGDIVITDAATLKSDATAAGNFGGTIDVAAAGDGTTTGRISIAGLLTSIGRTGTEDVGGGDGGCISIDAAGDLTVTKPTAKLVVDGGAPDGSGGEVELISDTAAIVLHGATSADGPGTSGTGGSVSLDAVREATMDGPIAISGGDSGGGDMTASSDAATVQLTVLGSIDVSGTSSGSGGSVCLENGTSGSVVVEGRIDADGGGTAGAGGTVDLSGIDAVRVASTATLTASGAAGSGGGGAISVEVDKGLAQIDGPIVASGGGPSGGGGAISIDASQRVTVNAALDVRAPGPGGQIGLSSTGPIDVRNNLLASSSAAAGGKVELTSQGGLMIAGTVSADGISAAGQTQVLACVVTVCGVDAPDCPSGGVGVLSSRGPDGVNSITGRNSTLVLGSMVADSATGTNKLIYNGDTNNAPAVLGSVVPNAQIIVDHSIVPCPVCGNHTTEPPETCDDGNQLDGDGCSSTCQAEGPPLPGDANSDLVVGVEDVGFAITEIFDGDGDSVGTVSGGTFAGGPGADANGDGKVTAADLTKILLLVP